MTLDEIALKYETDKSSRFHNYTEKYDRYFSLLREKPLKILEIGIQNGYSLKTWKDYFPNAKIFGIDVMDCSHMAENRIIPLQGSQTDTLFLKKVHDEYGPFDIIIDDGSHNNNDMRISFDFLFPLLAQGGLYVVEDLHCCYWPEFDNGRYTFMDRLKELLDSVNGNGKCGLAEIQNLNKDLYYKNRTRGEMDWWEKNLEYIHLYRSIVFLKKNMFGNKNETVPKRKNPYRIKFFLKKVVRKALEKITQLKPEEKTADEIAEYRKKIKVYDSFIFFNELDLLEMRMNILDPYVDHFVIVEATETFSGKPKPLYFQNNKDRFKKWNHKIIHHVTNKTPATVAEIKEILKNTTSELDRQILEMTLTSDTIPSDQPHWLREFYQKECIKKPLANLNDDDICYISDVDEIWNPESSFDYSKDDIFKFQQQVRPYFFNNLSNEKWAGTIATKYKNIKNASINYLDNPNKTTYNSIKNGGWHFTNLGTADQIRTKIESYGHQEFNTEDIKKDIENKISQNKDFIGRGFIFRIDESNLPLYITENRNQYESLFKK